MSVLEDFQNTLRKLREADQRRGRVPLVVPAFVLKKLGIKWTPELTAYDVMRAAIALARKEGRLK